MPDTQLRAPKATDQLEEDHRRVRTLLEEYGKCGDQAYAEKAGLFEEIEKELTLHARIEEAVFYPAIEGIDDEDAGRLVDEAHEEHEIVRTLLGELSGLTPRDPAFDAKVKVLGEQVEHHASEEEKRIFPLFRKLEKDEQRQVSEDLRARRVELSETPEEE